MPHDHSWFSVHEPEPGVHRIAEPHHVEEVSSYLIEGTDRAILLDTGMGVADIRPVVEAITSLPVTVVNSHADWDHIGSNAAFGEILIHPAEAHRLPPGVANDDLRPWFGPESLTGPLPDGVTAETIAITPSRATGLLHDGGVIDLGGRSLTVMHVPGHSPGLIALHDEANGILFSTDAAYDGPLYAARGPALVEYAASLRRLADLAPGLRRVYPSHNRAPFEPALLPLMAGAVQGILDGAGPVATEPDREVFEIDGVRVYLFPHDSDEPPTQV